MELGFKKFSSIENSYRKPYMDKILMNFPKKIWVVLEKIHGSNFGFWTDGVEVKAQKRTQFIEEEDKFFSYKRVLERERENILEYFENCKDHVNGTINELIVYGELCGGSYPHPDVKRINGAGKVQSFPYYSNDTEFLAFDAKVNGVYIDVPAFNAMSVMSGVKFIPVLFEGTLEECLAYSNEYQTTIPTMLGLPSIEDNICEGNVIKPKVNLHFPDGERVIIKNKNDKFNERHGVGGKEKKAPTPVPEHLVAHMENISKYINENRLRGIVSKVGIPSDISTAFPSLIKPFNQDIIEDFLKDHPEFQELDKNDRKRVTSAANKNAANLLKANFKKILSGDF